MWSLSLLFHCLLVDMGGGHVEQAWWHWLEMGKLNETSYVLKKYSGDTDAVEFAAFLSKPAAI